MGCTRHRRPAALRAAIAAAAGALALAAGGCGSAEDIRSGGVVGGETLTVYSLLPHAGPWAGTARDLVDGEKLALRDAGGRAGRFKINFSVLALDASTGNEARAATADTVRRAVRDPAIVAAIADLSSRTARVTVPLLNEAGVLHVSPGATYAGFVARVPGGSPDEPERWVPSGRRNFATVAPSDAAQAVAIARAARGRVAVEAEANPASQALGHAVVRALRTPGGEQSRRRETVRLVDRTAQADTVVYAGMDPEEALAAVESLGRETPGARVLLPEALLRTDLPRRLPPRSHDRVRFLSSAPPSGGPPGFAAAFRRAFGREPGPYARVGYEAMRRVLAAVERAGARATERSAVIESWLRANPPAVTAAQPFFLVRAGGARLGFTPVG